MAAAAADDFYYYRKSGQQIPAFGDWENVNELPITQYFECARQAGLLRCSCSDCATSVHPTLAPQTKKKTRGGMNSKELQKRNKLVKVVMMDHQHQPISHNKYSANLIRSSKPVDEDLYKIPSELLHQNSKRGKKRLMLGLFSRCMVPPCVA